MDAHVRQRHRRSELQIPGTVDLGSSCVGGSIQGTLNVCNTGKADLVVDPIVSSDPQFAVTTPSAGYPVVVSPDFCFPFQVTFTPAAAGLRTAKLTIPTNDPVNACATVEVRAPGRSRTSA